MLKKKIQYKTKSKNVGRCTNKKKKEVIILESLPSYEMHHIYKCITYWSHFNNNQIHILIIYDKHKFTVEKIVKYKLSL